MVPHSWGRGQAGGRGRGRGRAGGCGRGRSGEWGGDAPVQLAPPRQVLCAEEVAVKTSGGTAVSWLWGRLVLGMPGQPPGAPPGSCAVQGPQLVSSCPGPAPRGRQGMATLPRAEGATPGQTSAGPGMPAPPRAWPRGAQLGLDVGTPSQDQPSGGPEPGVQTCSPTSRLFGPCPPGTPRGNPGSGPEAGRVVASRLPEWSPSS